ncbi:hypothetical protein CNR22_04515 [Sphingobacteriaceae bacterium]|nr:hypothetical protein CNR22_04515 [Sphingobacteriaceae bacterium]
MKSPTIKKRINKPTGSLRIKALLGLLIFSITLHSQNKKDSLWSVWKDTKVHDTVRFIALDKICQTYYTVMPDTIIAYTNLAYDFSKKINYRRGMAQSMLVRAATYGIKGDYKSSLYYNKEVLKLNTTLHNESGINKCYLNMGTCYEHLGDQATAVKFYYRALKGFSESNDTRPAIVQSNKQCMAFAFGNLAGIYRNVNQSDSALMLIKKALAIHTEMKNTINMIRTYNALGNIYYYTYDPDNAIPNYKKAIALCTNPVNDRDLADSYTYLAQGYIEKGDFLKAKEACLKALKIGEQLKDSLCIGITLNILSSTLHELGDINQAIEKGAIAFRIFKNVEAMPMAVNKAINLAMLYSQVHDLKKAKEMYAFYFKNRDVSNVDRAKEELFRSQVKYDFEKKQLLAKAETEKKLNALKFEAEQKVVKRNTLLIIVSFLLLLILLSALFIYNNFRQKNIINEQKHNLLKQQLLVSQMNPHFIFNSLTAVQNFIFRQDSLHAGIYLKKFSELIRMILDFSRKDVISLSDEHLFLQNYLELQKLRFDNKLNYELKIDPQLEMDMVMIPPMLAQPFIENAIEHGIFYKNGEGFLSIKISLKNNTLLYEIEDDGIGLSESLKLKSAFDKKHKSLAIQITKERIETMNMQNNTDFEIEIKDKAMTQKNSSGVYVKFATPYLTL